MKTFISKIAPGEDAVGIRPQVKGKHTYYMGTVTVATARVRLEDGFPVVFGTVIDEFTEQVLPTSFLLGRMRKYEVDEGEITAAGAYIVGDTIYVSKDVK